MAASCSEQTFVVVDLETTGGSAHVDRIIEVAALRVRDGVVEDSVDTLVDPGQPLPSFITRLTGISSPMLRGRPRLDQVLPRIERVTRDAVLVAHNASFDYGFLAQAFRRAGRPWETPRICTLKLSRRLLPGLHSYKLDSLCGHLSLPYVQQHRAAPDAEATRLLLAYLLEEARKRGIVDPSDLLRFQDSSSSVRRRKGRVDEAQVASLPTTPGVYLLKDDRGHIVYVGKSINVRQRVRQHLRPSGTACSSAQPRLRRRLPYISQVEAIETGSELGALFLESKLVKRYLPDANRLLRDYRDYPFIKLDLQDEYPRLIGTRERPSDGAVYFGPFRRASVVASAVLFLTELLGLRQCSGSLRPGQSSCPLLEMKKCLGPCVGAVSKEEYRRVAETASRVLRGEDTAVLAEAIQRRDSLAEELRFEEASLLRDQIRDLERIIAVVQRLQAFADRNLVVVTEDTQPGQARLFLVRRGRLIGEQRISLSASLPDVRKILRKTYANAPDGPVTRDEIDDMLILDAWLRQRRGETTREITVPPDAPATAASAVQAALSALADESAAPVALTA